MSNEKKQVKTNDLFGGAFASAPVLDYWKNVKNMSKTTNNLCAILYPYFSTETGRYKQHKEFTISTLRSELGTKDKLASRSAIDTAIKEIKEMGLFFINENFIEKTKTITFYLPSEKNKEIFEKVSNNQLSFFLSISENVRVNNVINMESHSLIFDSHSLIKTNDSLIKTNDITKNVKTSQIKTNDILPETVVNTDKIDILETRQDYLYKDNLSKETLTLEKNISNNSTLEKKLLESELKVKAFLESEVKEQIQEQEKEITLSQKDENELDRLKGILISDYQMYEMVAEKLLKQYSTKAINECIDLTIDAEVNDKIKSTPRDFLMNKLKYWVEKKESVQETSLPYKKIVASMPGESDFINIFYSKKLVHISQKTLGNCVQSLITCARKDIVLEIKEKFSREQIGLFINHFQNTDTFAHKYTNDVARFWQFYNDIQELDKYNQELKERNEKARLEIMSKFNGTVKKETVQETLVNDEKILSDLQDDLDSEDIPY